MRSFIAISLPPDIKDALARMQEKLKKSGADVKWVAPANIHLTLKFLGDLNEKKLEAVYGAMEDTAKNNTRFYARIRDLGAFPKVSSPRIIWAGIGAGDEEIKKIARQLEESIARVGIPKEDRPFSCHITLGRTKSALNLDRLTQDLTKNGKDPEAEGLGFDIEKITFFKSTLTPKGPLYEALKEASLRAI
ncbi:MAG: RNA 2',3'-cyclic phosphodiesterase [Candidatus Omnitrophica bacterium]|nr:RNA 2',3'-cyclic phosphodiesterase [Candidatus Omnitrophota bacterium]